MRIDENPKWRAEKKLTGNRATELAGRRWRDQRKNRLSYDTNGGTGGFWCQTGEFSVYPCFELSVFFGKNPKVALNVDCLYSPFFPNLQIALGNRMLDARSILKNSFHLAVPLFESLDAPH
jgi:hypothetical protein